jgi:membrane dipeptidase
MSLSKEMLMADLDRTGPVLVTGATGKQGGAAARALLARGVPVRALVRDLQAKGARALQALGANLVRGDLNNVESLRAACEDVRAVFSIQTPDIKDLYSDSERIHGRNLVEAAKASRVAHFVHTSVSGAGEFRRNATGGKEEGWGKHYWESKAYTQDLVREAGFAYWTLIRPGFFMENFIRPSIFFANMTGNRFLTALAPTTKLSLVAVKDIGEAAAAAICNPEKFNRVELELAGELLTLPQVAEILSVAWDESIEAPFLSPAEALAQGLPSEFVTSQVSMNKIGSPARPEQAHSLGLTMTDFSTWAYSKRPVDADSIHQRVLKLDGHVDVLLPPAVQQFKLPDGGTRADLDHLTRGGINALVLSVAVGPGLRDADGIRTARKEADAKLDAIKTFIADNPERVGLALSADDVVALHEAGKIAVIIGFQNTRSIGDDLSQLDAFFTKGTRVFCFTHAGHNSFSDSARPLGGPVSEHGGLSALGREAVKRLNDLGALIDVAQLSKDALLQTVKLSRAPVAATHVGARTLVDIVRNLSDEELDAIKANEGVVMITPFPGYLVAFTEPQLKAIKEIREKHGLPGIFSYPVDDMLTLNPEQLGAFVGDLMKAIHIEATLDDYIHCIDYVVKRVGVDHVGIGTDFNHGAGITGFESEADAPNVTRELVAHGYSEEQIAAIWSGNFLRVLRAAEAAKSSPEFDASTSSETCCPPPPTL